MLYHQFAWTYDLVSWFVSWGQWQEWIRLPLSYLEEGPILELGCGPGHLLLATQKEGKSIFGLDLSPQMLRISRKRLINANLLPVLTNSDGRSLPFASGRFTQAVATFPTEYVFTLQTLQEIYRVLDEKGEFICIPMAWISEKGTVYRFLGWLFRITGQSRDLNNLHLEKIINLFSKAGFHLQWEIVPLKHSNVLLFRASKDINVSAK
ncbi:MAG: methyltransferase domain-containing protein [Anaerolineales bacterium]